MVVDVRAAADTLHIARASWRPWRSCAGAAAHKAAPSRQLICVHLLSGDGPRSPWRSEACCSNATPRGKHKIDRRSLLTHPAGLR